VSRNSIKTFIDGAKVTNDNIGYAINDRSAGNFRGPAGIFLIFGILR
jgi:hypothetical protein